MRLKNVHHVSSVNKNLVSRSRLYRDGFKLGFESNKVVISKFGQLVGKGYGCGGLFRLSLSDICTTVINNMFATIMSLIFSIQHFVILTLVDDAASQYECNSENPYCQRLQVSSMCAS